MKRILIIEDEKDAAEILSLILKKYGYSAEYTLDPLAGLNAVEKYDLLLLDLLMPKMSGRQVLAELQKRKIKTPVIIVTAIAMPGEVKRDLSQKFGDIILVPKNLILTHLLPEIKKKIG